LSRARTTLTFLQNFVVTTSEEYLIPTKNPRWSKGVYSWKMGEIRAQKCLEHLDHLKLIFKLAGKNKNINNKIFPKEVEKRLQGVQGGPDLLKGQGSSLK
jgi:hypothetical protein